MPIHPLSSATMAFVALAISGASVSAQAVVQHRVRPGGSFTIGMTLLDSQCRPVQPIPVFVASRPRQGRLTSFSGTDIQRDHPNPACNGRPGPALFFRYTAPRDFIGQDRFAVGCRRSPPSDCRPFTMNVTVAR
ncbi:hypothetical protein SLNSH_15805 [Alsobacter soli]|uniref:Uncharacterized protein n=1 Tax=Alsobacter soli TaxID=2109933 RepID=A0A2T1HQZ0_9HYPH|nr:hypothetical protein [Alsobacter soli]PSC04071.1 hypothetical protein SLNSH_15805 [Alsobacter soli]